MKANELMIDDWVYNKNIDKPMQIYPTIFSQMFRSNPNATTEDYNIFPVSITPEILEKNGWKWREDCMDYYIDFDPQNSNESATINVLYDGHFNIFLYANKGEFEYFSIEYVHELQHAMRLCGIKKEIIV